jgi:hypothetical protein
MPRGPARQIFRGADILVALFRAGRHERGGR